MVSAAPGDRPEVLPLRRRGADLAASVLLAGEAVGVLVLAVWEATALASGNTSSVTSSIALLVLTVLGAAGLGAFAAAVGRGSGWGRSGGVVAQLLVLAVAGGALTGAYANPTVALTLGVPAAITLILLLLGVRRAGARRDD